MPREVPETARRQADRWGQAVALYGLCEARRERVGRGLPMGDPAGHEHKLAFARAALGEAQFSLEWQSGRAMAMQDAIAAVSAGALNRALHSDPERSTAT